MTGNETTQSSKELGSASRQTPAQRPVLTIAYTLPSPQVSISDVVATEGKSGTAKMQFQLTLSAPSEKPVSVEFATTDDTARAGNDYQAAAGTVTFAPGETTKTIAVNVNGDQTVERDETFSVSLRNATNATIAKSQGQGTIANDDVATFSINHVRLREGNSGTKNLTFTVTLDKAVDVPVNVDFATNDGTAFANSGDYTPASGTLHFAGKAGESQTITVAVRGDRKVEFNETLVVNLANVEAVGRTVTIARDQGTGTIFNDDQGVSLQEDGTLLVIGSSGSDTISFSTNSQHQVLCNYNGKTSGPFNGASRIVVYGGSGNDRISVSNSITLPCWLYGGNGTDTLIGGGGENVLSGGADRDLLQGGSGRNLLLGGDGADTLRGGIGDDLLIGGRTTYDNNNAALAAIMAEWTSTRSFTQRRNNLTAGITDPVLGLIQLKTGTTVLASTSWAAHDSLYGGSGNNWLVDLSANRDDDDDDD